MMCSAAGRRQLWLGITWWLAGLWAFCGQAWGLPVHLSQTLCSILGGAAHTAQSGSAASPPARSPPCRILPKPWLLVKQDGPCNSHNPRPRIIPGRSLRQACRFLEQLRTWPGSRNKEMTSVEWAWAYFFFLFFLGCFLLVLDALVVRSSR